MSEVQNHIISFTKYKNQIDGLTSETCEDWRVAVSETIKLCFNGIYNGFYQRFKTVGYLTEVNYNSENADGIVSVMGYDKYKHFNKNGEKERAKEFIDRCIEFLKNNPGSTVSNEKDKVNSEIPELSAFKIYGELIYHMILLEARINVLENSIEDVLKAEDKILYNKVMQRVHDIGSDELHRLIFNHSENSLSSYLNYALTEYHSSLAK